MTHSYEFRVTGDIGPVICSAVPELTADPAERSSVLTGSVTGINEMTRLLERLEELHLVETYIRLHRNAAPADAGVPPRRRGHAA